MNKRIKARIEFLMAHKNPWVYRTTLICVLPVAVPLTWLVWAGDIVRAIGRYLREGLDEGLELCSECWGLTKEYARVTTAAARVGWAPASERDALVDKLSKEAL